jgi:hypothetical protein
MQQKPNSSKIFEKEIDQIIKNLNEIMERIR